MYEVELKLRVDNAVVRERLEALGASFEGVVSQVDTYYDAPDRDFAETDEAFRIRRETPSGASPDDGDGEANAETAKLTYKGPLVDGESKTREEHETAVANGAAVERIVEGLGYSPAATVEKERSFYSLDGYTVTLDRVAGVGEFVEVEIEVDDGVEAARDGAQEVLRRLDLDPDDQIRTSYLGMLLSGNGDDSRDD